MESPVLVCVTVLLLLPSSALAAPEHPTEHHWSYIVGSAHGPGNWSSDYETCNGTRQSPINLETSTMKSSNFPPLKFHSYSHPLTNCTVQNNGHSVYVEVGNPHEAKIIVNEGGLAGNYRFASLHFHWGSLNDQGSEHTVNKRSYPLEMHMVHFNTRYGSLAKAVQNTDGLAVIGVFFELSENDNDNLNFKEIFDAIDVITYKDDTKVIDRPSFTLESLLPTTRGGFFRYYGSLTTPTCNEVVTWTVLETKNIISIRQLKKFRSIYANSKDSKDHDGKPQKVDLVDNYRPLQPLKNRKVWRNPEASSSGSTFTSTSVMVVSLVASLATLPSSLLS